ncbi:MAG: RNA-binding protein [Verrucomicrobia bacterium]|nr:MAG: RNA-binding protein [Verrucomicrobiota bacterium]
MFWRAGAVTAVELMLDPTSSQSRGFAFVTMATPELAAAALRDLHCCELCGRHITVTEARPPSEPKGRMSEGFDSEATTSFRPGRRQDKQRGRSPRSTGRQRQRS